MTKGDHESSEGGNCTHWASHYSGQARDYEAPDADVLGALAGLKPGEALDVGCGAGGLCLELNERGWAVTGIDITSEAIASARRLAQERGAEATFVTADATSWRPEQTYELVCSSFGLPPEPKGRIAVYAMMRQALTPGGVVLIKIGDTRGRQLPAAFRGYDSLNLDELRVGFKGFEILLESTVEAQAHTHGRTHQHAGARRLHERWKTSLFMARKPCA
ncbi:MAG: methyltransferase domain-containing protein [Planctomycetes bacterium]|nr:methyltransferase domain-containing protein [Planctomycetota bacterium]